MQQEERAEPMQIAIVGIDLSNNACSLAGLGGCGTVAARQRVRRENVLKI
jgi:hypothetical protein